MVFELIRTMLGLESSDSSGGTDVTVERESQEDAAAAGTDAAASTGSMTEEPPEPDAAAEPAEAAGPTSGADSLDPGDDSESVENVSGIGPAYADRLSEAGIETVDQLLAADPEELAADTDLSAKRIGRWQERAEEL
jgi:predicted flap endonuclease-1-like 5' DNA nuclease